MNPRALPIGLVVLALASCGSRPRKTLSIKSGQFRTQYDISSRHLILHALRVNQRKDTALTLTNIGDTPLIFNYVETSCGCTSVEWPKEPIAHGHAGTVKLAYTPDQQGFFKKSIYIFANISPNPIEIVLEGEVN